MARIGNRTHPGRFTLGTWRQLEARDAQSYLEQQVMSNGRVTVVRCVYPEGSAFAEHRHLQEQVTIVEEGSLEFLIGEDRIEVRKGQMITIEPNVAHATQVTRGCPKVVALNLFIVAAAARKGARPIVRSVHNALSA